jgi:hypothetical protein
MFVAGVEVVRLTAGLEGVRRASSTTVVAGGRPLLRVRRGGGAGGGGRAVVELLLLDGARAIDVSLQPSAAVGVVRSQARRSGHDPNGWTGALSAALAEDGVRWNCWVGAGGLDLLARLGGMAHPLLGAAYAAGAEVVAEVPRWAAPVVSAE